LTVADRLARFNRRLPNRVIGTIAGRRLSPVAFMLHQGRRSGRHYRTPVMPLPLGDGFLVSLPYGPERDWVRNVLAAGRCALLRGGRRFELTDPRLLDAAGAAPLLPAALRPPLRALPGIHFVRLSVVRD
jgi:deazaflavin-dependent oxidoreductase (nitroreductase family)